MPFVDSRLQHFPALCRALPMPLVKSSDTNIQQQLSLVLSGKVDKISGYVFDDQGQPNLSVLSLAALNPGAKVHKHGLTVVADILFTGDGLPPQKYGRVERGVVRSVRVHLCGKTSCRHGRDVPIHLGEWYYAEDHPPSEAALAVMNPAYDIEF